MGGATIKSGGLVVETNGATITGDVSATGDLGGATATITGSRNETIALALQHNGARVMIACYPNIRVCNGHHR